MRRKLSDLDPYLAPPEQDPPEPSDEPEDEPAYAPSLEGERWAIVAAPDERNAGTWDVYENGHRVARGFGSAASASAWIDGPTLYSTDDF